MSALKTFWVESSWQNKAYLILTIVSALILLSLIYNAITRGTVRQKMKFLEQSLKDNSVVVGRISCFIQKKDPDGSLFQYEYAYEVDHKLYFLRYDLIPSNTFREGGISSSAQADSIATVLPNMLLVFFDKNNPNRAITKFEILTSKDVLRRKKSKKQNMYRDLTSSWSSPIVVDW